MRFLTPALHALAACLTICQPSSTFGGDELPVIVRDDFAGDLSHWRMTDGNLPATVWTQQVVTRQGQPTRVLRVTGQSLYEPPVRSPHSIAWLDGVNVSDFQLDVELQSTRPDAGPHRDLCVFWGRQDADHFYYVHLGAQADPNACQIFIVNGTPRTAITKKTADRTPWTDDWHHVRVLHNATTGTMSVYFDDLNKPLMTAVDHTFPAGEVGLGTFDDHGNFDDFVLRGKTATAADERGDAERNDHSEKQSAVAD